jgi:hypothetical protein
MPLFSYREEGGVFLVGFKSSAMVLWHLKAILMSVCLKKLVIFLICGDVFVKVAHFFLGRGWGD